MAIHFGQSEHVFICGQTGTGKTWRAQKLLRARATASRVIAIDPKAEFWIPGAKLVNDYHKKHRIQIFRPDLSDGAEKELDQYDRIFRKIWQHGEPITIYVDELNSTLPGPNSALRSLDRIYRQGRSKRITVWSSTQVPKQIPSIVFQQSTHMLIFWLNWESDAEKVESFTYRGVADQIATLKEYEILYCCPRRRIRQQLPPNVDTATELLHNPSSEEASPLSRIAAWLRR